MPACRQLAADSGPLPVAERTSREILSLRMHEALSDEEVARVIDAVNSL